MLNDDQLQSLTKEELIVNYKVLAGFYHVKSKHVERLEDIQDALWERISELSKVSPEGSLESQELKNVEAYVLTLDRRITALEQKLP